MDISVRETQRGSSGVTELYVEKIRDEFIDRIYVGFSPNTTRVKPVHIANGFFRAITGTTYDTSLLNRFVVWATDKGLVPPKHDIDTLYEEMRAQGKIVPKDCPVEEIIVFRALLRKIVDADGAVYLHKDDMESYTAGYEAFVTKDRVAQDGGEFAAAWLRTQGNRLIDSVAAALRSPADPITALCLPLLSTQGEPFTAKEDFAAVKILYNTLPEQASTLLEGLAQAAETLSRHIDRHPNKLVRLRWAIAFVSFFLVRYLTALESCYVPSESATIVPFLLDMSDDKDSAIARASESTYDSAIQSVARFYSWAFAEYLRERYSVNELWMLRPQLGRTTKKKNEELAMEIWRTSLLQAKQADDPYWVAGQALYDILALQSQATPIQYLRNLGVRCGLLYPPSNRNPAKRFVPTHDLLEVLVRGAVAPGEVIGLGELQRRFWKRFGIIIGGLSEDEEQLLAAGAYQADGDALRENQRAFVFRLTELGFARELADGIVTVEMEASVDHGA